jgi:hypothetical protein
MYVTASFGLQVTGDKLFVTFQGNGMFRDVIALHTPRCGRKL